MTDYRYTYHDHSVPGASKGGRLMGDRARKIDYEIVVKDLAADILMNWVRNDQLSSVLAAALECLGSHNVPYKVQTDAQRYETTALAYLKRAAELRAYDEVPSSVVDSVEEVLAQADTTSDIARKLLDRGWVPPKKGSNDA